jgi:hypothetical protein
MTTTQKQYMKLSNRLTVCNDNVTKYEIGRNYNGIKKSEWQDKANQVIKKMNNMNLTDSDFDTINEYYGC